MLAHETMPLEERKYDLCFSLRHLGYLGDICESDGLIDRIFLQCDRNLRRFLDLRIFSAEEVGLNAAVFDAVEHGARCGQSIAPCSSRFLVIGLDRSRKVVMNDESYVLLVDSKSKRIRRNNRLDGTAHECVLHLLSVSGRALSVIETNRVSAIDE